VQQTGSIVVTEINYNPTRRPRPKRRRLWRQHAVEFIELYNGSPYPYDLTGLRLSEESTSISPGAACRSWAVDYAVVVRIVPPSRPLRRRCASGGQSTAN